MVASVSALRSAKAARQYNVGKSAGDYYVKGQQADREAEASDAENGGNENDTMHVSLDSSDDIANEMPLASGTDAIGTSVDRSSVRNPTKGSNPVASRGLVQASDLRESGWFGEGAKTLGLSGVVDGDEFERILEGKVPGVGQIGRQQKGADNATEFVHAPGIDITFSAPKSVSVMGLVAGDRRVIDAHVEAVKATLSYLEKNVLVTRKSVDGRVVQTDGQKLVAAMFREEANRNLEPQLHTHVAVANLALDGQDGEWRAADLTGVFKNKMLLGLVYHSELARGLVNAGYQVGTVGKNGTFEIEGVPPALATAFSSRREEIKAILEQWGRSDAVAAASAAVATRSSKQHVELGHLLQAWREFAKEHGHDLAGLIPNEVGNAGTIGQGVDTGTVTQLLKSGSERAGGFLDVVTGAMRQLVEGWRSMLGRGRDTSRENDGTGLVRNDPHEAVLFGLAHLSERNSQFTVSQLRAAVLNSGLGVFRVSEIDAAIDQATKGGVIVPAVDKAAKERGVITTAEAIAAEQAVIDGMMAGKGAGRALAPAAAVDRACEALGLDAEQTDAARLMVRSSDRYVAIQGFAGTGKTTLLKGVESAIQGNGKKLLVLSQQADMVERLSSEGFEARTVAWFLSKYAGVAAGRGTKAGIDKMSAELANTLIVVDEASRLSVRQARDMQTIATRLDLPKLGYAGDRKQLEGVEAGSPYAQMLDAGISTATLTKIRRQINPELLQAVHHTIDGRVAAAIQRLGDENIFETKPVIQGIDNREAGDVVRDSVAAGLVARWMNIDQALREETIVVCASNATRAKATSLMRESMTAEGQLGADRLDVRVLVNAGLTEAEQRVAKNYEPGRQVRFDRAMKKAGIKQGEVWSVIGSNGEDNTVKLTKDGKEIDWRPDGPGTGKGGYVTVYDEAALNLAVGDKVRWTAPDKSIGVVNGTTAKVTGIEGQLVSLATSDGQTITADAAGGRLRHLDHDWIQTTFRVQGATKARVLMAINSRERLLNNLRTFYVNLTRAREHVDLVCDDKFAAIRTLVQNSGDRATALSTLEAREHEQARSTLSPALAFAVEHLSEREAVFDHSDLLRAAAMAGLGQAGVVELEREIERACREGVLIPASDVGAQRNGKADENGVRVSEGEAQRQYTTPTAVLAEREIVSLVRENRQVLEPVTTPERALENAAANGLNAEQTKGVVFALTSRDRFVGLNGLPGVGKTTLARALREGIESVERKALGLAPSTQAVKELSDGAGIEAMTLQKFLQDHDAVALGTASEAQIEALQYEFADTHLIIDEMSLAGTVQARNLLRIISALNIRATLVGDIKQNRSPEAGRPYELMQDAGMATMQLRNILRQRQNERYLDAVKAAANDKVYDAFKHLGQKNITEVARDNFEGRHDYRSEIAAATVEHFMSLPPKERRVGADPAATPNVLIVTPTRAAREMINRQIHHEMVMAGEIGGEDLGLKVFVDRQFTAAETRLLNSYQAGEWVRFHSGPPGGGRPGEYMKVVGVNQQRGTVQLQKGDEVIDWRPGDSGRGAKVSVYEEQERRIGAGEYIRWTDTDRPSGIINGRRAQVTAIGDTTVTVKIGKEQEIELPKSDPRLRHFDYAYAVTSISSQGATARHLLLAMSSRDYKLANMQQFLVGLSRGALSARFFTDNLKNVQGMIQRQTGKATSALDGVGFQMSGKNDVLDRWISGMDKAGNLGPEDRGADMSKTTNTVQVGTGLEHSI